MRLDEDKLETLRRWGEGLRRADGEEQAAAGRAILLLLEEIERLQIELSQAYGQPGAEADEAADDQAEPVAWTLQERLQRALRRDADRLPTPESTGPEASYTERKTSPQSWIDALRRQR
jgi:hypothetical protein